MKTETTYKITGAHAARLAVRDRLTLRDGCCIVRPIGWTGASDGANVTDYFRGSLGGLALSACTYLGPDENGLEPVWEDA